MRRHPRCQRFAVSTAIYPATASRIAGTLRASLPHRRPARIAPRTARGQRADELHELHLGDELHELHELPLAVP